MTFHVSGKPDPAAMQRHLATLQRDFTTFDTARERVQGKPWIGGGPDRIVSKEDLQVVRDNPSRFTQAQAEAARFFLDEPSALGQIDTAAGTGNPTPDNRIGPQDVNAAVRDTTAFASAGTFISQQPAIPLDGATQQQAAAATTLQLKHDSVIGKEAFVRQLRAHQGDAGWLQGYLRALGAQESGTRLYGALAGGGDGRTQAREALQTLQQQGLLNSMDLASVRFKTTPRSEDSFSLKTLLEADHIQQAVEARRRVIDQTGGVVHPDDTSVYDAYDALLTVTDPQNSAQIQKMADRYGIDPALLGGTVAAEMDFDHDGGDVLQDGFWRMGPDWLKRRDGPGVTSVHDSGLEWAVKYLEGHGAKGAPEARAFYDAGRASAADLPNATESAAIVLAALTDLRKSHGRSVNRPEDMAVIWAAFRTGVGGSGMVDGDTGKPIPEGKGGYPNLQAFLDNRLDDAARVATRAGDPHLKIGGNAYQSEPYFDALMRLT